ncbi:MAG: BatA and WFA domain-containing protein [Lachnospiraceae bacterium]|nr:BatA and WFA domain-containing protein [Lachnospiraceae bacterium]
MKFTHLWPLAFVILIPVILIMYMMKQKAKEQKVSSLYLWSEMIKNDRANTPWEKLKKNWLMILQIITLLVLIAALTSPYFLSGLVSSGKACVIIDTSASMNFMYDENQTRIEKAKDEAISYVKKLRNGTEISLITSDKNAVLLAAKSQNKNEVIEQIKNIECSYYPGDASEGVDIAKSLAIDSKGLQTIIITDTSVDCANLDAMVVDVYSDIGNVAIEYVSHGFKGDELSVLVKVSNSSKEDVKRDVSIYQGENLLMTKEVEIEAESSEVVYFEDVVLEGTVFCAQISGKDACDEDNICYDVLSDGSERRVLLMTEANIYLEKALNLIPGIVVTKSEDIASLGDFTKQEFDLYIFDGLVPETLPSQGNIIMFGCECEEIAPIEDYIDEGRIVYGLESKTTKYLDGLSFGVGNTYSYKVPDYATAFLATEGNSEGSKANIAFIGEKQGRTYAMLGFDLHNSDFPLYMEYPVLMYNLVNDCINGGIISESVYSSGDAVPINSNIDGELPSVTKPDQEVVNLSDYRYNYSDTRELGIYTVSQTVRNNEEKNTFVVNFPVTESRIDTHPSMLVTGDETVVTEVKGIFNLRNFIIILALLLLCLEWIFSLRK